jgi:arylsulfatase A-like enzyme
MVRFARIACLLLIASFTPASTWGADPPRLVVVVSFDQFRGDMPSTFARFFGSRGFRRVERSGAVFTACFFDHANTITGPGHAALLTGCYAWKTGIVGNDFCDLATGACVYCADDERGVRSAAQLLVPTVGDVLRQTSPRSKVVGVALKDRAAILMAGPSATACVWYDPAVRAWTSSTAFPGVPWLASLNRTVSANRYAGRVWTASIPDSLEPAFDTVAAEGRFPGGTNTFPHVIPPVGAPAFIGAVLVSPFSVDMVFDAATMALRTERLGADAAPDILCVGVSTTDYVGHTFGPDSREVQELYVHVDRRFGRFIDDLDRTVGRSRYVLVVTSDHGVAPIPELIRDVPSQQGARIDAGRIREAEIKAWVDSSLTSRFGPPSTGSYVRAIEQPCLWLNDTALRGRDRAEVVSATAGALRAMPGVGFAASRDMLLRGVCPEGTPERECSAIRAGTHPTRTGDVVLFPKRYWIMGGNPATHGTAHDYDQHVPLMVMGGGVAPQRHTEPVAPVDIAPTVARMLGLRLDDVDGAPLPLDR